MFLILPLMSLSFCFWFTDQISSLDFQCVTCDTIHLVQCGGLMRSPGFRWQVRSGGHLQLLHRELSSHILELLFRSWFVTSSKLRQ